AVQPHPPQRTAVALHEHIRQRAVGVDVLRVHHRVAAAKTAELAGRDRRELPGPQRFAATSRARSSARRRLMARAVADGAAPKVSQARPAVTSTASSATGAYTCL